jgi:hypothetical protein
MRISKYLRNLWYIIQHKWFVLLVCWRNGLYWQGIVHDLSKFSPIEFYAYSWNFFAIPLEVAGSGDKYKNLFQYAWLHHQHHNKHHWNYWVVDQDKKEALPIPDKYLREMLCDWAAMSRKFGDTPQEFFNKNRYKMVLHPETVAIIERKLSVQRFSS